VCLRVLIGVIARRRICSLEEDRILIVSGSPETNGTIEGFELIFVKTVLMREYTWCLPNKRGERKNKD